MKVVVAIDSFKGSLTSMEAALARKEGILKVKNIGVVIKPVADGGEGTTEAITEGLGGEYVNLEVKGPMLKPVMAKYGVIKDKNMAVIEMAKASGIILVSKEEKNPLMATTFGVGEMIKDAIKKGIREFIIGIGGSATNDGGVGMLIALGYEFLDKNGNMIELGLQGLSKIETIKAEKAIKELKQCKFTIACDVNNPLCGENGATYVYGAQKGVKENDKKLLIIL